MARHCIPLPGGGCACGVSGGEAQQVVEIAYEGCAHTRRMTVGPRTRAQAFVGMSGRCVQCGVDRRITAAKVVARR
jgi:hypothetical protein